MFGNSKLTRRAFHYEKIILIGEHLLPARTHKPTDCCLQAVMTAWTYPLKQTWKPTWRSFLLHSLLLQINRKVTPFKKTISWSKNLCSNKKPSHPTRLISSHMNTHTRNEFIILTPTASLPIFFMKTRAFKDICHISDISTTLIPDQPRSSHLYAFINLPKSPDGPLWLSYGIPVTLKECGAVRACHLKSVHPSVHS